MKQAIKKTNELFATGRMEALTDGVFAIAMTLLILDIKVQDFGGVTSSAQLFHELAGKGTVLISFVISFLLLGSLWAVHMRQLSYIDKTDRHLTTINTYRLLLVVFVPLTTSISGAYPDIILARMLLPINFLLIAAVSFWEWTYATSTKGGLATKVSPAIKQSARVRNITIIAGAGVVVALSPFIGQLAFLTFATLPFVDRLVAARSKL